MSDELKKAATSIWSDGQSQDSASASPSSKNLEAGLAVDVACTQQANDGHPNLVTRILSLVRTRECGRDHCPPPDGGRQAWTQVLLGHIVCVNSWGYINAFGVFQSYYTTTLSRPPSDVSWIGALQIFFLFFMATFSGRATDGGYFKFTWSLGAIITVVSLFLASLSRQYWQLLLSQGVLQGLGFGLMFCPMLALIPTYFERRRAVAITAIITGCGTGGLIFSLMTNELINRVGFPWAMRTLGFFTLATLLPGFFLLRQRLPPRKSGPVVEWRAFCELPYALFSIGMFLVLWGLYIGGILREQLRAGRTVARFVPGIISDRWTGPMNLLVPSAILSAVVAYAWAGVNDYAGVWAWSVSYGILTSVLQGIFPVALSSLTTDLKKLGVRMGMVMTIVSFAVLTGTPIAGALVRAKHGEYLYMQMFMGSSMMLGGLCLLGARIMRFGFRFVRG
ncbi:hypothetical protein VTN49DRAFT_1585 [Thermomyces lanuginosus]|uniref:uncharacterized protein n=1 Tax=Thermomyces lanuginosus TaxID=5541 RepID=UPI003742430E